MLSLKVTKDQFDSLLTNKKLKFFYWWKFNFGLFFGLKKELSSYFAAADLKLTYLKRDPKDKQTNN